jgi:hypothetical protein
MPHRALPSVNRVPWMSCVYELAFANKVHAIVAENTIARANGTRAQTPALLRGLI